MAVKNILREIRHALMIDKQIEMAQLLGIQQQQYNRYERQQIQPTLEIALKIVAELNRPVESIFYMKE